MAWQTVFDGDSNNIGGIQLDRGNTYRITLTLPIHATVAMTGLIYHALQTVGVNVDYVNIPSPNQIEIEVSL